MKKIITCFVTVLLCVFSVSCGKNGKSENVNRTEIDTGIPNVVMMIEDNLTEDENAKTGDNRVQYVNSDGKAVEYRRWDSYGNTEVEKYNSYHSDGRLYQELFRSYRNGELLHTELNQYEFKENSREATVTVWTYDHVSGNLQTDSVVCTMTTEESELYCSSFQSDPLQIRGMYEYHYGMLLGNIQFLAGQQVETDNTDN